MFADPTYLYIYDDEDVGKDCSEEPWVVNMCMLMIFLPMLKKKMITTNLQVHLPPQRKYLLQWVT